MLLEEVLLEGALALGKARTVSASYGSKGPCNQTREMVCCVERKTQKGRYIYI